jgi:hypothetical protein
VAANSVRVLQTLVASGALELVTGNREEQMLGPVMGLIYDKRDVSRRPWRIFNTEHNSRWETESMSSPALAPPSGWLYEEDPGDAKLMLTAGMLKRFTDLINELKVALQVEDPCGQHLRVLCKARDGVRDEVTDGIDGTTTVTPEGGSGMAEGYEPPPPTRI